METVTVPQEAELAATEAAAMEVAATEVAATEVAATEVAATGMVRPATVVIQAVQRVVTRPSYCRKFPYLDRR